MLSKLISNHQRLTSSQRLSLDIPDQLFGTPPASPEIAGIGSIRSHMRYPNRQRQLHFRRFHHNHQSKKGLHQYMSRRSMRPDRMPRDRDWLRRHQSPPKNGLSEKLRVSLESQFAYLL